MKQFRRKKEPTRSFVSYPKSGRTWVRYALLQMGAPDSIHFHHDGFEFNDGSKPELNFEVDSRLQDYQAIDRVVYLERDPRDVMCSLYHQVTGRFKDFFDYQGDISAFLRDPYFGADNLHQFRQMWAEIANYRDVLRISYEEMTDAPRQVLKSLSDFYEIECTDASIEKAADEASFDRMKSVEQSNSFEEPWLKPRNGHPKVRSGKVMGFTTELNEKDIAFLNDIFELDQ